MVDLVTAIVEVAEEVVVVDVVAAVDVIKISQSTMIIVKPSLQLACPYLISWKRKFPEEAVGELRTTRRRRKITKKILVIIIISKIHLPILEIIMLNTEEEDTTVVIITAEVVNSINE